MAAGGALRRLACWLLVTGNKGGGSDPGKDGSIKGVNICLPLGWTSYQSMTWQQSHP